MAMVELRGYWDVLESRFSSWYLTGFSVGFRLPRLVCSVYVVVWGYEACDVLSDGLGRYKMIADMPSPIYCLGRVTGLGYDVRACSCLLALGMVSPCRELLARLGYGGYGAC